MLTGHRKAVTDISFRPDGLVLASTSLDRTLRLWDPFSGKANQRTHGRTPGLDRSVAYSPDGKSIATGGG